MSTVLAHLGDTYLTRLNALILSTGADELGQYFIPSHSIYYSGGGGQPPDKAELEFGGQHIAIIGGKQEGNELLHYIAEGAALPASGSEITIRIDGPERMRNAKLHTAGHLVASAIHEGLGIAGLLPRKGYHYPDSPYVEFEVVGGEYSLDIERVNAYLRECIASDATVTHSIIAPDSDAFATAHRNAGFEIPIDQPLRLLSIDHKPFLASPCGGTHVRSLGELGTVQITKAKLKRGNLRVGYALACPI